MLLCLYMGNFYISQEKPELKDGKMPRKNEAKVKDQTGVTKWRYLTILKIVLQKVQGIPWHTTNKPVQSTVIFEDIKNTTLIVTNNIKVDVTENDPMGSDVKSVKSVIDCKSSLAIKFTGQVGREKFLSNQVKTLQNVLNYHLVTKLLWLKLWSNNREVNIVYEPKDVNIVKVTSCDS